MTSSDLTLVPVADELVTLDDSEAVNLTTDEAEAITSRIRQWANSFPVDDVARAFRGRIWIALAYGSWAEWCECELGGLKLPVPLRRQVVSELADAGMSNVAIGAAINADEGTVRNDRKLPTSENSEVGEDHKTLGQDGRERSYPPPKPSAPQSEPEIIDAEIVDSPTARRPALPGLFQSSALEAEKIAFRIRKYSEDDRFNKNAGQIAADTLGTLTRARDAMDGVITQLEGYNI